VETEIFKDPYLWQAWTYCLMKATRKDYTVRWRTGRGSILVPVKPGQFVFGRFVSANELGCPPSSIRNRIEILERTGMLDIQPDTHYSIVTICNWEHYQSVEEEEGQASGQASGQALDTYNNTGPSGVADANASKGKPKVKTYYDEHGIPYPVLPSRPPDLELPQLQEQGQGAEEEG